MIFGREDSNGAWEAYGGNLAKRLEKELQKTEKGEFTETREERLF